ncbi:MAG: DNA-directed RNA polymerase subunit omega [Clostridia bacterium]|nr:DNA-directed RNA polymerase subunit omega [Clostridia bacterium]
MMLYPSIMDLMEKAGNRYSLVIAASKRARDILEDAKDEMANIDGARSITKAVEEIAEGEILIVNETKEQELEREAEYQAKVDALEAAEQKQAEEALKATEPTEAE